MSKLSFSKNNVIGLHIDQSNVIGLHSDPLPNGGLVYKASLLPEGATPMQQAVAEINPRFVSYCPTGISVKRNSKGILASIKTSSLTLVSYL
jgi:hypothetical protein